MSGATAADRTTAWLIAAAAGSTIGLTGSGTVASRGTPWSGHGGFRLNAPAALRLPLRLGEERRWLRLQPLGPDLQVELDGRHHLLESVSTTDGRITGRIDGEPFEARVEQREDGFILRRQCLRFEFAEDTGAEHHASAEHEGHLRSPMPGRVLDVRAQVGDRVEAGAVLVVLEAMKMEHALSAPWSGTVSAVAVKPGDRVEEGVELVVLEPAEAASLRQAAATE